MFSNKYFRPIKHWLIGMLIRIMGEKGQVWLETLSVINKLKPGKSYEKELELLNMFLKEGDTCIDVGANIGIWSYHMSKAVGNSGKVFAIEPMPLSYKILNNVISKKKLNNVESYKIAFGEKEENVSMNIEQDKYGMKSLSTAHISKNSLSQGSELTVPVKTLDKFISSNNINNIKLIKCDIEGAELPFIKGGMNVFKNDKPILICEIQATNAAKFGYSPKDVFDLLDSFSYQAYLYRSNKLVKINLPDPEEINYVFINNAK